MLRNFTLEKKNRRKATQSRIDKFCMKIGKVLPDDYQQFLLKYNGIIFKDKPRFYIPEIKKHAKLYTLYGFDFDNSSGTNLEKSYYYNFNYGLNASTLAIGHCVTENGCLSLMIIKTDTISGIFVCDLFYDDFVFAESSEDNNTFKVACSFSEFIAGLI